MKHFYLLLLLFGGATAMAQGEPSDSAIDAELYIKAKRPYVFAEYGYGALCNSISTAELINFTSTDFLTNEDKDELLNSINGPLRFGYFREINIGYKKPGYQILDSYKRGNGFSLKNKFITSATLSNDLLKLALYGNKPYVNQMLDLGNTKYESWYYTTLDYNFDMMIDSLQPVTVTVGLNVGHDYTLYNVNKGSLTTAPNGEFLDLDVDYQLRDRINESQAMAGLGLSAGASTTFKLNHKASINLTIEDFGFIFFTGGRKLDADSTFRFRGIEFSNIFDLNDSLTQKAKDEYTDNFYYNEDGNFTRLTPFKISAGYMLKLNRSRLKALTLAADYRYLAGYYPRLALGTLIKTGYKQELMVQLTTGGYNLASLDLGYKATIARHWSIYAGITNFSGLVVPVISGGAYGIIGLSWEY